jgi:DNA-binding MarR family transcriptional regulator
VDRRIPASTIQAQLADRVWGLLVRIATERVHSHLGAAAAEFELAPAQAFALGELDVDRPIAMRELAGRLKCDPSNITGLIDRLEARGLVERQAHPSDRRVKYVALTTRGRTLRNRLAARAFAAPSCIACLSERDQVLLHDALLRVLDAAESS